MREALVNIDDNFSAAAIIKVLEPLVSMSEIKLKVTLLATYMVDNINSKNAVQEYDRVKGEVLVNIGNLNRSLSEHFEVKQLSITNQIEMGSSLNVLPRVMIDSEYEILILDHKLKHLIPKIKDTLINQKAAFPSIILYSDLAEISVVGA